MLHVHAAYLDCARKGRASGQGSRAAARRRGDQERRAAGLGLTRPELAVLLAYAKITATQSIVASDLPDDAFARALVDYFPSALRERFAAAMTDHPLRREIIATCFQCAGEPFWQHVRVQIGG